MLPPLAFVRRLAGLCCLQHGQTGVRAGLILRGLLVRSRIAHANYLGNHQRFSSLPQDIDRQSALRIALPRYLY